MVLIPNDVMVEVDEVELDEVTLVLDELELVDNEILDELEVQMVVDDEVEDEDELVEVEEMVTRATIIIDEMDEAEKQYLHIELVLHLVDEVLELDFVEVVLHLLDDDVVDVQDTEIDEEMELAVELVDDEVDVTDDELELIEYSWLGIHQIVDMTYLEVLSLSVIDTVYTVSQVVEL